MIDVYTANTPNGVKVPITLEELGAPYRIMRVNLAAREQKRSDFLRINPNGRIPAIVDPDGPGGVALSVFESGAIVWYLAEKFGALIPTDPVERIRSLEYTFFQVGGIGPMFGQAGWFARSAPERVDLAIERYQTESNRLTIGGAAAPGPLVGWRRILGGRHHELRLARRSGLRRRRPDELPCRPTMG